MKWTAVRMIGVSLLFSGASLILAQPTGPSRVLRIFREDIKSGKGAAHERVETGYVRALSKAGYPSYIALEGMSGLSQAWFLERYASYEELEKSIKMGQEEPLKSSLAALDVQDGELRTGERGMIAIYQPELSYTPGQPLGGKNRYYSINMVRVRAGHTADYAELRKMTNAAFTRIGSTQRRVVYLVTSGAPTGTYLILSAMESLKAMDPPAGSMTMREAYGAEYGRYEKLLADTLMNAENTLFAINPKMSNPPKDYVATDPDFWTPKPKVTMAKPVAKPVGAQ